MNTIHKNNVRYVLQGISEWSSWLEETLLFYRTQTFITMSTKPPIGSCLATFHSSLPHTLFVKDIFQYYLSIYSYVSQLPSSFQFSKQNHKFLISPMPAMIPTILNLCDLVLNDIMKLLCMQFSPSSYFLLWCPIQKKKKDRGLKEQPFLIVFKVYNALCRKVKKKNYVF